MYGLRDLQTELKKAADTSRVSGYQRFFKTGPGEYGAGDKFLGLTVPQQRKIASKFISLNQEEIRKLLYSPWHEFRLTGLIILVSKYERAKDEKTRASLADFYLSNLKRANNWDLIDLSAPKILGAYLISKTYKEAVDTLLKLASSDNLWERRAAIVSTLYFIRKGKSVLTLKLVQKLINDKHDLIHKACGWMLREVGKNCGHDILEKFLLTNASRLPRTTLRYSLEHFPKSLRQKYMDL